MVIITQNQNNLKRIDTVLVWPAEHAEEVVALTQEGGQEAAPTFEVRSGHIFIHENSEYFAAPGA
jgi:hypothetical protein